MHTRYRIGLFAFGTAMIASALFWSTRPQPEAIPKDVAQPAPTAPFMMLVAARDLEPGAPLSNEKSEWIAAPRNPPAAAIVQQGPNDTSNPYIGRLIIQKIAKGDAFLPSHFASAETTNYVAQLLEPGKRAYAITIDTKGSVTAGNFILPNDRVDIIRSFNSSMGLQSETILSNIRILAIGQSIHGEGLSSTGDTATVEVELREAELLATAQRTGQISLALRNPYEQNADPFSSRNILIFRPQVSMEKSP